MTVDEQQMMEAHRPKWAVKYATLIEQRDQMRKALKQILEEAESFESILNLATAALAPQPAPSAAVWTAEQISQVETEASELLAKGRPLPTVVESDAKRLLDNIDEMRKTAIACGWKVSYIDAFDELAAALSPVSPDTARDAKDWSHVRRFTAGEALQYAYDHEGANSRFVHTDDFDAAIDSQLAREGV